MYNFNMETKVFEELKKIIKEKFDKEVEMSTILVETGIDSLDLLDLIVEVEDQKGVKISDQELLDMKTIEDVVKAIASKI